MGSLIPEPGIDRDRTVEAPGLARRPVSGPCIAEHEHVSYAGVMELTTVRLPEELSRSVDEIARRRRVSRSAIVRDALEAYCRRAKEGGHGSRAELLRTLVSYPGSGVGDLGSRSEQHLRERFHAHRRRHR